MLTEIPKIDNTEFISLEDTYVSNAAANIMDTSEPMEVVIKCPHKQKRISAFTSGSINISAQAKWENVFDQGALSVLKKGPTTLTSYMSWMTGQSVMQPWMNRKMWKSTEPFTLRIPITFASVMGDAKSEVFDPCMALLSFVYPRQYGNTATQGSSEFMGVTNNEATSAATVITSKITELADSLEGSMLQPLADGFRQFTNNASNDNPNQSVVGAALNAYKLYNIPGPSLKTDEQQLGDPVTITIGPVFNLGVVYLENVEIEFSKTLNPLGYPLAAKVTLTASPANACYCRPDGSLVIFDEFDSQIDDLNNLLDAGKRAKDSLVEGAKVLVESFISTFKATANLITGGS